MACKQSDKFVQEHEKLANVYSDSKWRKPIGTVLAINLLNTSYSHLNLCKILTYLHAYDVTSNF